MHPIAVQGCLSEREWTNMGRKKRERASVSEIENERASKIFSSTQKASTNSILR